VGAGEIIYRHRERRPQLLSGQTRPIGTGQEISRSASDYEREGEQVSEVIDLHQAKLEKMKTELAEEIRITLAWISEVEARRERASK
jgi:hypothetical protein